MIIAFSSKNGKASIILINNIYLKNKMFVHLEYNEQCLKIKNQISNLIYLKIYAAALLYIPNSHKSSQSPNS